MRRVSSMAAALAAAFLMAGIASFAEAALSAPSLTATPVSTSQVNLSWTDPNPNEAGYQVERSLSSTTGFAIVATLAKDATSFSNTGLAASTTYYFRVKATSKGNGGSPYSNVASGRTLTPTGTTPPAPSNLAASGASSTQINLSWTDNSTNETAFKIERATSSAGPWAQIATTAASSYANAGLATGTTYYYRVRAYNSYGDSAYSNTASATPGGTSGVPPAPTGLTASAASSSQINLSWTDTSSNESGFKIERSSATSGWVHIWTLGVNATTYANTGLAASTAYSFRVRAYNTTSGDSGYSNTATATTSGSGGGSASSRRYGDTNDDRGQAVAVGASGNVAVTGHFQGITDFGGGLVTSFTHASLGPSRDVFVASYSPTGGYIWAKSIGGVGNEEGKGVAVDGSGNVLVTGFQGSYQVDYGAGLQSTSGANDIFVAKYSSTGGYIWSKTVGGTGYDSGMGIAADASGNVIVTGGMDPGAVNFGGGALASAGQQDMFLVKYSAAGAHVWSRRFGGTLSDSGIAVATDPSGNVIVTGTFEGSANFGGGNLSSAGTKDIFVAKYSSAGAHLWSKRFGSSSAEYSTGIAVDGAGDIIVSGKFPTSISFGGSSLTSAGGDDAFLAKLSGAAGAHVWSKRFGGVSGDSAAGVSVDASNNVAVAGHFGGTVDFGAGALTASSIDVFVAKYSPSGAAIWTRKYGLAGYQFGSGVAMARTGQVSATGFFASTVDFGTGILTSAGVNDAFLTNLGP